jgi:hypothetical protein
MGVVLAAVLLVLAPAAVRAGQQPQPQQPGVPQQPAAPAAPAKGDPGAVPAATSSARTFTTPAGMIINAVRPERVADFEKVIGFLQDALASSTNATVRAQAEGWRVLKASENGPNGAVLYVFLFDPAVPGAEYGLGRILAEAYPDQTKLQEIWKLYTDALASGGSLLSLTPVQPAPAAGLPPAAGAPQP